MLWLNNELVTQTLWLSATTLSTLQGQIPLEQIHTLEINPQRSIIRLLDIRSNELFSMDYFLLFSADLFITLMEHMIYHRIPGYSSPATTR